MTYGIDVSEHNGAIGSMLDNVKPSFVIIRAGVGTRLDHCVKNNIKECSSRGIPMGFYWYSYALTPESAATEANQFNEFAGWLQSNGYKCECGYWLDMEDGDNYKRLNGLKYTYTAINPIVKAFCKAFIYEIGVYTSQSWLTLYDYTSYPLWIAYWGSNNGEVPNKDFSKMARIWQFTSKYKGRSLDGNIMYESFATAQSPRELLYMAIDTLDGLYGNGDDRKKKLGMYYNNVQEVINLAYELSTNK